MNCPECHQLNAADAAICTGCGLILLNVAPVAQKRRSEDLAVQKRRAEDEELPCRFCGGSISPASVRCRHCSEIVDDDYFRERATRIRARVNYASWVCYIFGLAALLIFRPVGATSIAVGLMLSIIYYAIPVEPTVPGKRRSIPDIVRAQMHVERVHVPIPAIRKMKFVFVGTPLLAAVIGYGANMLLLQKPIDDILEQNVAFHGMKVSAHYQYWVVPGVIVYDLRSLSFRQRPIDVHTAFLEFARDLKEKKVKRVDLAYQGNTRFSIDGDGFRQLGTEYDKRNFEFVLYSFPKMFHPEAGTPKQKDNGSQRDGLLQFHRAWYGDDAMTKPAVAK